MLNGCLIVGENQAKCVVFNLGLLCSYLRPFHEIFSVDDK